MENDEDVVINSFISMTHYTTTIILLSSVVT